MADRIDYSLPLVSALLVEGVAGLNQMKSLGIGPAMFRGVGRRALEILLDYVEQHKVMPDANVIVSKIGRPLPKATAPSSYYCQEAQKLALWEDLRIEGIEFARCIEEVQPYEALDKLESMLRAVRQTHKHAYSSVDSIPRLFGSVLEYYDKIKAGEKGVLTPWPTVNEETLGFWPEDLALFVARMGIGKTWAASLIAHHAWMNGHKVLFGTTEISKMRIAMRFAALHFKLPYAHIRKGMLGMFEEQKFREGIKEIMDAEGLHVIGGDFDFRVESYEAAVESVAPKLSILDGAYLLKTDGATRTERAANAFDELKRICKRTQVPNVVTMQFNREVKANVKSSAQGEKIALTDVAGWNADLIYGLIQTEDMKRDRRMIFKPLKVREGEGEEFEVNWDIDNNNFSELPKTGDDEYGTGASGSDVGDVPF